MVHRIAIKSTQAYENPNDIRFENVYVYSKLQQQLKYRYLENLLMSIDKIGYFTFSNNSDVIPSNETRSDFIFIFDNVACDKQDAVREYFSIDHHATITSTVYLCQTYAKIPIHLICESADPVQTGLIYNDHMNTDMYDEFCSLCRDCRRQNGFLVDIDIDISSRIDKDSALEDRRYKKGFNSFVIS